MPTDTLLEFISAPHLPVLLGGIVLLLVIILAFSQRKHWLSNQTTHSALKARVEVLRQEMDERLVEQFNDSAQGSPQEASVAVEQHATERTAYETLWPLIWALHEKLGSFLRAVEAGDTAGDTRVAARHAALDARHALNRARPFCHQHIDAVATQLIDTDIKAHLAGCQYLDLRKETENSDSHGEGEQLRQKFRVLYDVEARGLMNELVELMRRRMVRHSPD